jgi:hypothetical protein
MVPGFKPVTEVPDALASTSNLSPLKLDFSAKLMVRLIRIGC